MKILVSGDFCPIGRTEQYLQTENYAQLFNGFDNVIKNVDFAVVNLECPITTSGLKRKNTGPCLKTSNKNSLKALQYAGFNLLTLANNHIQDYSGQGVLDTIAYAHEHDLKVVGANATRESAAKPFVTKIKNISVAFINISENEFCAATETNPGAYTFDFIDNTKLIQEIRGEVDKIILIYHGGREHYQLPTPEQRRRLRYFIEIGVDAIVAHHTHCVSGYEYYMNKPIVYSLGNFIFDYKRKYQKGLWTEGMSVILDLPDNEMDFTIELLPHLQGREEDSSLVLLEGGQKDAFLNHVDKLSEIILNDRRFFEEWCRYVDTQEGNYLSSLVINNYFIRALFIKGILPVSLLKRKSRRLLLNLIRCETHLEMSRKVLSDER